MGTNVKASFRYQLKDALFAILVFYIVMACVTVVVFSLSANAVSGVQVISPVYVAAWGTPEMRVQLTLYPVASVIFLFVVGLCSFKENFLMLMQNGCSRRSVFAGRLLAGGVIAVGMALIDELFALGLGLGLAGAAGNDAAVRVLGLEGQSGALAILWVFLYMVLAYFVSLFVGYCITVLYYRLLAAGKLVVSIGIPVVILGVLPILDGFAFDGRLFDGVWWFTNCLVNLSLTKPSLFVLWLVAVGVVLALLCWLMMRRAPVRR